MECSRPGRLVRNEWLDDPRVRKQPRLCAKSPVSCASHEGFIVDSKGRMESAPYDSGLKRWKIQLGHEVRGENSLMTLGIEGHLHSSWSRRMLESIRLRRTYIRCNLRLVQRPSRNIQCSYKTADEESTKGTRDIYHSLDGNETPRDTTWMVHRGCYNVFPYRHRICAPNRNRRSNWLILPSKLSRVIQ
jgi:hypothetical protein